MNENKYATKNKVMAAMAVAHFRVSGILPEGLTQEEGKKLLQSFWESRIVKKTKPFDNEKVIEFKSLPPIVRANWPLFPSPPIVEGEKSVQGKVIEMKIRPWMVRGIPPVSEWRVPGKGIMGADEFEEWKRKNEGPKLKIQNIIVPKNAEEADKQGHLARKEGA
jgi:hypothetical protein